MKKLKQEVSRLQKREEIHQSKMDEYEKNIQALTNRLEKLLTL